MDSNGATRRQNSRHHPKKENILKHDIQGLWPATLTPVEPDGRLDIARSVAHTKRMLAAGCDGVALFGTTGEGPAFSNTERKGLLEATLVSGVRPEQIVVTTSTCALPDAIDLGRHASTLGCHRQLFLPPFYFRQPASSTAARAPHHRRSTS